MDRDEFVENRQPNWRQLEGLSERARRDVATLSEAELAELGRLYRAATSDLALVRRDFPDDRVTLYLNQLVARTHALVYREEPLHGRRLWQFYAHDFPLLYRRLLPYTTVAFLLFLAPALVAFFVVWRRPDAIYTILGPGIRELVRDVEQGKLWTDIAPSARATASTFIFTHNIQVMFLTFAGGVTAGLLTVGVLVLNGLDMGALFGLLYAHGLSGGLAEFVVAHGFAELSVVFLAGGCGLYLGDGLLRPGLLSRRDALAQRGAEAVRLILGCIPLLVVAGLIEGLLSPSSLPASLKLATGLASGAGLYAYWLRAGRGQRSVAGDSLPPPWPPTSNY